MCPDGFIFDIIQRICICDHALLDINIQHLECIQCPINMILLNSKCVCTISDQVFDETSLTCIPKVVLRAGRSLADSSKGASPVVIALLIIVLVIVVILVFCIAYQCRQMSNDKKNSKYLPNIVMHKPLTINNDGNQQVNGEEIMVSLDEMSDDDVPLGQVVGAQVAVGPEEDFLKPIDESALQKEVVFEGWLRKSKTRDDIYAVLRPNGEITLYGGMMQSGFGNVYVNQLCIMDILEYANVKLLPSKKRGSGKKCGIRFEDPSVEALAMDQAPELTLYANTEIEADQWYSYIDLVRRKSVTKSARALNILSPGTEVNAKSDMQDRIHGSSKKLHRVASRHSLSEELEKINQMPVPSLDLPEAPQVPTLPERPSSPRRGRTRSNSTGRTRGNSTSSRSRSRSRSRPRSGSGAASPVPPPVPAWTEQHSNYGQLRFKNENAAVSSVQPSKSQDSLYDVNDDIWGNFQTSFR